jgi:hypothetical protein
VRSKSVERFVKVVTEKRGDAEHGSGSLIEHPKRHHGAELLQDWPPITGPLACHQTEQAARLHSCAWLARRPRSCRMLPGYCGLQRWAATLHSTRTSSTCHREPVHRAAARIRLAGATGCCTQSSCTVFAKCLTDLTHATDRCLRLPCFSKHQGGSAALSSPQWLGFEVHTLWNEAKSETCHKQRAGLPARPAHQQSLLAVKQTSQQRRGRVKR